MSDRELTLWNIFQNLKGGGYQTYSTNFARLLGSVSGAVFCEYIIRWSGSSKDGWAYRTDEQIEFDTCITRKMLRRLRPILVEMGVLEEDRRGFPARMHYRIVPTKIIELAKENPEAIRQRRVEEERNSAVRPKGPDSESADGASPVRPKGPNNQSGPKGRTSLAQRAELAPIIYKQEKEHKEKTPNGVKEKEMLSPNGSNATAHGTRIDEGFEPDAKGRQFALESGMSEATIAEQIEAFRDYWVSVAGAKARKASWQRTWRTWCRRWKEDQQKNQGRRVASGGARLTGSNLESAMRERMARNGSAQGERDIIETKGFAR